MDCTCKAVDFYGIIVMLRQLIRQGYFTEKEGRKIAAHIADAYGMNATIPL